MKIRSPRIRYGVSDSKVFEMSRKRRQNQQPIAPETAVTPRKWVWRLQLFTMSVAAFAAAYFVSSQLKMIPSSEAIPVSKAKSQQIQTSEAPGPSPVGMVWIPAGEFQMGSLGQNALPNEQPAHRVALDGFWMDDHEITNQAFEKFVEETSYRTTAEIPPDWEELKKSVPPGTPKPSDDVLVAGSLVFNPPDEAVPTNDVSRWWTWTPGACWNHPEGPASTIDGRADHPVVHVSWDDAVAYAKWIGKRLPTEAEWEYASRGNLVGKRYCWGDEPLNDKSRIANIWQGHFPDRNDKVDGWERTSPMKTFAANGYGLFDMSGNVWEWCSDWYRADAYVIQSRQDLTKNPIGPASSWDPAEPNAAKRVIRGGSFLCHLSYCESYRVAARRGNTPDTGMSHLGFRCVKPAQPAESLTFK